MSEEIDDKLKNAMQRDEKSRMTYWFPKIYRLDCVPKTIMIPLTEQITNEEEIFSLIKKDVDKIKNALYEIGFPAFIRTDISSAKFSFNKSCYIEDDLNLENHLYELIVYDLMRDIIGISSSAIFVREYIEPIYSFKAFHGLLPIAKERRYFIRNGDIQCHHPYWIEESIQFPIKKLDLKNRKKIYDEPKDWKKELHSLNMETNDEINIILKLCRNVIDSGFQEGYWSIDFMKGKNGKWYLIDMAEGNKSWHPECPFKQEVR